MKVIIAGTRNFTNYNLMVEKVTEFLESRGADELEVVSGRARGADRLGERLAQEKGYSLSKFPADWNTFGKSAGYRRNAEMAKYADGCIVFWDGVSKGTKHMIDLAKREGLDLKVVTY